MERTTNSADARRAADYLSRYCADCIGCVNCIFDTGDEGQSCHINNGVRPYRLGVTLFLDGAGHRACKGHDAVCKNYRLAY